MGRTLVDWRQLGEQPANALAVDQINADGFFLIIDRTSCAFASLGGCQLSIIFRSV